MGLHLDWEIEADQTITIGGGEDPATRRARRKARWNLLLGVFILLGILGSLYGVVWWRLQVINSEIERALRDTVDAEIATLRVGDRTAFLSIQRSASDAWAQVQAQNFEQYQQVKAERNLQLTGEVVSLDVDGNRGRVQVQEIVDGVPYVRTWFYWRYAEGWRHVPPDYTFWGDVDTLEGDAVRVRYRTLDQTVAEVVLPAVSGWVSGTCAALTCGGIPTITIDLVPDPNVVPAWAAVDPWTLRLPSPYTGVARLDRPFDPSVQVPAAALVAERLTSQVLAGAEPIYPADAFYLKSAVQDWLIGRYTSLDTGSTLVRSYAERYGDAAVGEVLRGTSPGSDVRVLLAPAGVGALNELAVDWRDYLTWRLTLESELHAQRNEAAFVALYDTLDANVAGLAFNRFATPAAFGPQAVVAVQAEVNASGVPVLAATVQGGEGATATQQVVRFRLSDGLWKRAS
jgi:hypothetical protein